MMNAHIVPLLVIGLSWTLVTAEAVDVETVGVKSPDRILLPVSQTLSPAGIQVDLPRLRPQVVALHPKGGILVTSGKTSELIVLDPETGALLQRVGLPPEDSLTPPPDATSDHFLNPDRKGQVSYTGLVFSPDGSRIYLSNVNGSIKVFGVDADRTVRPLYTIPLPNTGVARRGEAIPAGLAVDSTGRRLYVALNLSNRLLEVDLESGGVARLFDVGVAPYDVVLAGSKAYVSNWGGRRPDADSLTGPAGKGTRVRVDRVRHIASEGSVSVVELTDGTVKEFRVGLHASDLAVSPDGRHLAVANAGDDTVSVIDLEHDDAIETIALRWHPNDFYGASPNALAFDPSGDTLYVCHGTQNAVGVIHFDPGESKLQGLIPTGWYPGAIAVDARRNTLCVANIKGVGSGIPPEEGEPVKYQTHQYHGTLSIVQIPTAEQLEAYTRQVALNYRRDAADEARKPARPDRTPQPIPERTGEPSVFKHVIYIIKENRTYDQVLGDMPEGDGDPSLCIFGEEITPNQHKLAREFVLLDNTYCSGILSADGHQWSDAAFVNEYLEKSFAGFPRSYPDGMDENDVDALAYSSAGFLWDNALAHGRTLRVYGEFTIGHTRWKDPARTGSPTFSDYYQDFIGQEGNIEIGSEPAIESLRGHIKTDTIGWHMSVPDVFRAAKFIEELAVFEQRGEMPNLIIICLPNDHTSGTQAGMPTPAAAMADNDLAFGRIVEAVSHSSFWKDTCIFAIEDDPQAGWDHISGYRTTAYVASPWTRRGERVSAQYNQPGLIRSIELILGLPPMNLFDATASPFTECFTEHPDFAPYSAVPNRVPLDQLNPDPRAILDPRRREDAIASAALPLEKIDQCPEDVFNRILWFAQKGHSTPYPEWAIINDVDDDD